MCVDLQLGINSGGGGSIKCCRSQLTDNRQSQKRMQEGFFLFHSASDCLRQTRRIIIIHLLSVPHCLPQPLKLQLRVMAKENRYEKDKKR